MTSPSSANSESRGPLLLTSEEAAWEFGICPRKLWELMARGEIPHVRIGRAVRYSREDLESWIEQNRRRGPGPRGDP